MALHFTIKFTNLTFIFLIIFSSLSTNLQVFIQFFLCVYTQSVYNNFHRLKAIYCDEKFLHKKGFPLFFPSRITLVKEL